MSQSQPHESTSAATIPEDEQLRHITSQLGRCVLLYQRIEVLLKLLLPHMSAGTDAASNDGFADWQALLDGKHTLGGLTTKLSKAVQADEPQGFEAYLRQVVEDRNQIVHHFLDQPFAPLDTIRKRREAMTFLQQKQTYALGLHVALTEMSAAFVEVVQLSIEIDERE